MAKDQIRNHLTQHVLYIISLLKTTTNKQWCRHLMQALELTYQQLAEYNTSNLFITSNGYIRLQQSS